MLFRSLSMEKTDGAHWEVSVRYCVLHVGDERSKDKMNRRPKLEQDGYTEDRVVHGVGLDDMNVAT